MMRTLVREACVVTSVLALVTGCSSEPAPSDGPAGEAVHEQPAQEQPADARAARAAKAASTPFPAYPPKPVAEDVPGDGKMFPLVVTLWSDRTGEPLSGWLSPGWKLGGTHPKAEYPVAPKSWDVDGSIARVTFPTFPPCLWDFALGTAGGLEVLAETAVWTQPPGGVLDIHIEDFEWKGRVLGFDGAPIASGRVHVLGKGLQPDPASAPYVRYLTISNETRTDENGRFRLTGMHSGIWMVSFETTSKTGNGGWRSKTVRRFMEISRGQVATLGPRERSK